MDGLELPLIGWLSAITPMVTTAKYHVNKFEDEYHILPGTRRDIPKVYQSVDFSIIKEASWSNYFIHRYTIWNSLQWWPKTWTNVALSVPIREGTALGSNCQAAIDEGKEILIHEQYNCLKIWEASKGIQKLEVIKAQ